MTKKQNYQSSIRKGCLLVASVVLAGVVVWASIVSLSGERAKAARLAEADARLETLVEEYGDRALPPLTGPRPPVTQARIEEMRRELRAERLAREVSTPPDPYEVDRSTWTRGEWPYTVDRGRIECREPAAVYFRTDDGRLWAVNGVATINADRYGAEPNTDPIWRIDEEGIKQRLEMGISREAIGNLRIYDSILSYGLEICGF